MTTFTPENIPKINDWLAYVSIPQLNLNLIDNSLIGISLKESYMTHPYETIRYIQELYKDYPLETEKIISNHNLKLCIKCNP